MGGTPQSNPKKIYCVDPGLVRALTLNQTGDLGKLFENVIYLDLRRIGCKVHYYLTHERYEVDFIAQSPQGQKKIFQVVWNVDDQETLDREKRALQAATKELNIDGEILTLDSYLRNGVTF